MSWTWGRSKWIRSCVLVLFMVVSCAGREQLWSSIPKDVDRVGAVMTLEIGGVDWRFRPYIRHDAGFCVAFELPAQSGGHCFVAGWAVETHEQQAVGRSVLIGVTVAEATRVVLPGSMGDRVEVELDRRFGGKQWFVRPVDAVPTGAARNEIAAFGADGAKLGNEHWNVGTSECPWAGPWDGRMDLGDAEPRPACLR